MTGSGENKFSRSSFLKKAGLTASAVLGAPYIFTESKSNATVIELEPDIPIVQYAKNDHIQIALIGAGKMGQVDARSAIQIDGVKLIAACDLYDSRLKRCKEIFGNEVFTTRDYREVLDRSDVDAVIIATSDHWHDRITIDALNKNKGVYVEKPMVQNIEEGAAVIAAEKNSTAPLTVGSTGTSSVLNEKARDLLTEGAIGDLVFVEAYRDRFSYEGAWQYPIPPSASIENIDWDTYLKDHPKIPFDPKRFFWYRNYQDYGTGVAGDLFVHLFSSIHQVTRSKGPIRILSTGGTHMWKDGRDVADIQLGLFDYPETNTHPAFHISMRVNFADGSGGGSSTRYIGTEGVMFSQGGRLIIRKNQLSDAPAWRNFGEFDESVRAELEEHYRKKYPPSAPYIVDPAELVFTTAAGVSSRILHFSSLFDSMRTGKKLFHDATYGFRACAPALASNLSYYQDKIINWDPDEMKLI
jgi:predicted dehydrogenase